MKKNKFRIRITGPMSPSAHFSEFKNDAKKLWKAAETGKLGARKYQYEIGVPDLSWIAKILSQEKLRLLMVVRDEKPQSLYELAKLLGRASTNVFRDVQELAGFGVLELKRTQREGRAQDVMRPEFPWDGFEIDMNGSSGHTPRKKPKDAAA
jgi:predicted transcriptional regulator